MFNPKLTSFGSSTTTASTSKNVVPNLTTSSTTPGAPVNKNPYGTTSTATAPTYAQYYASQPPYGQPPWPAPIPGVVQAPQPVGPAILPPNNPALQMTMMNPAAPAMATNQAAAYAAATAAYATQYQFMQQMQVYQQHQAQQLQHPYWNTNLATAANPTAAATVAAVSSVYPTAPTATPALVTTTGYHQFGATTNNNANPAVVPTPTLIPQANLTPANPTATAAAVSATINALQQQQEQLQKQLLQLQNQQQNHLKQQVTDPTAAINNKRQILHSPTSSTNIPLVSNVQQKRFKGNVHNAEGTANAHNSQFSTIPGQHGSRSSETGRSQKPGQSLPEYYCDVCKLVCHGQFSLEKHLAGVKHKKRKYYLDILKQNSQNNQRNSDGQENNTVNISTCSTSKSNTETSGDTETKKHTISMMNIILKCRVCNIPCISVDSYCSHIKGQRHIKTIAVNKSLGKPLPSNVPEIMSQNVSQALASKISAMFGGAWSTDSTQNLDDDDDDEEFLRTSKPIGHDFIEEVLNQNGKLVCYTCTLCECQFTNQDGKNQHLKGRKHQLQYKKKVDPDLLLDFVKSDKKKIEMEKEKKRAEKRLDVLISPHGKSSKLYEGAFTRDLNPFESIENSKMFALLTKYNLNNVNNLQFGNEHIRTFGDYLLSFKHQNITPGKALMDGIYHSAYLIEKSIRSAGRFIETNFLIPIPIPKLLKISKELKKYSLIEEYLQQKGDNLFIAPSVLVDFCRIVRTGALGQGLVLKGEEHFEMIILCNIMPTVDLLKLFYRLVPNLIIQFSNDQNIVQHKEVSFVKSELKENDGKFIITMNSDAKNEDNNEKRLVYFHVYLTSPYIRHEPKDSLTKEEPGLINYDILQDSLQQIRRYRWYRDNIQRINYFCFVIRILRDLTINVKAFRKLSLWLIELILERILTSAKCTLTPISLFRHFFEFLSHGAPMIKGIGLADPCENHPVNVFDSWSFQEIEDLFFASQNVIRLMSLRQLHRILQIDDKYVYKIRMDELGNVPQQESSNKPSSTTGGTSDLKPLFEEDNNQKEQNILETDHQCSDSEQTTDEN